MIDRSRNTEYHKNLHIGVVAKFDKVCFYLQANEVRVLKALAAIPIKHLETLNAMLALLIAEYETILNQDVQKKSDVDRTK